MAEAPAELGSENGCLGKFGSAGASPSQKTEPCGSFGDEGLFIDSRLGLVLGLEAYRLWGIGEAKHPHADPLQG